MSDKDWTNDTIDLNPGVSNLFEGGVPEPESGFGLPSDIEPADNTGESENDFSSFGEEEEERKKKEAEEQRERQEAEELIRAKENDRYGRAQFHENEFNFSPQGVSLQKTRPFNHDEAANLSFSGASSKTVIDEDMQSDEMRMPESVRKGIRRKAAQRIHDANPTNTAKRLPAAQYLVDAEIEDELAAADEQFKDEFLLWVRGRDAAVKAYAEDDRLRKHEFRTQDFAFLYTDPSHNLLRLPGTAEYFDTFVDLRGRFERQLVQLIIHGPHTFKQAFWYYKFVVRSNIATEKEMGLFLRDFQSPKDYDVPVLPIRNTRIKEWGAPSDYEF